MTEDPEASDIDLTGTGREGRNGDRTINRESYVTMDEQRENRRDYFFLVGVSDGGLREPEQDNSFPVTE